jgi:hypothetical protein
MLSVGEERSENRQSGSITFKQKYRCWAGMGRWSWLELWKAARSLAELAGKRRREKHNRRAFLLSFENFSFFFVGRGERLEC